MIGKGGSIINQVKETVGVEIRIARKGEYIPDTTSRKCTITGTQVRMIAGWKNLCLLCKQGI